MNVLAVDLGTTKVAVLLYHAGEPLASRSVSLDHNAAVSGLPEGHMEQSIQAVMGTVHTLMKSFSEEELKSVSAIGVTGQMHSTVLWNESESSNIVTWQDRRASTAGHLEEFRRKSKRPLSDGFGSVTMAETALSGELKRWTHSGTPADFLVCRMTGRTKPLMDPTFAASWGIFDIMENKWDIPAANTLGIPESILPEIVKSGEIAGTTLGFPGITDGIPVIAAFGDNQASVLGTCGEHPEEELFMTLGTGAQLSAVITKEEALFIKDMPGIELRPFTGGRFLAVAAPLCGGSAWTWLGDSVNAMLASLGLETIPRKKLFDMLDSLALQAPDAEGLSVTPSFLGERSGAGKYGVMENITMTNFTLPNLAKALGEGMIRNMTKYFPDEILKRRKIVLGSGNCLRFCKSIRKAVETELDFSLRLSDVREEACFGCARLAMRATRKSA